MSDAESKFINNANISMLAGAKRSVEQVGQAYGIADTQALEFYEAVYNGKYKIKEGQTNLQAYQGYLSRLSFSFKNLGSMAKNFFGNLGANVLNALGGMAVGALAGGLMTLAGKGIEWVYKKISGKAAEEAKQKIREVGEEARNAADEIKSNFESTKSTVDDISERYAELAQGVQNLGKATQNQGKLSNDDYKEFLDLSNQLAELFPQLTSGYDDNGNAILKLDGSVQNITTSIYSYVDALETANSIELQDKFDDIWKSYNQDMKDYSDQAQEAQDNSKNLVETYRHLDQILSSDSKQGNFLNYNGTMMPQILSEANIDLQSVRDDVNGGYDFSILTEKQIQAIKDAYVRLLKEYNNDADYFASQVETTNKNVANYIISSLQGDQMMQEIEDSFGDNGISLINGILSNLNYNVLYGDLSGTELIEQIKQDFIYNLSSLSDSDTTKVKTAWNNLLSIDTNAALEENIPKIEAYIKQIADLLDIDWTQLAPALGYDIDASKKQIQDLKDRMGYSHKSGYALSNKESDVNQKINDLTQGLTQDELDVLVDVELPSNVLNMTEEEFKAWIKKLQDEAVIDVETRTASDAVDSLADIKSALSSLEELYSQTVSQDSTTDGIVNGFASPDTLNAVESAFGGIAEEDAKVADALETFEETMVKFPNDSAKAQSAINNLITAYIDQTDVIKDLTDENKDYAKAQLKAMGITNAEEVVESRLTDTNKKLSKGYSELAKNVQEYNDAVDSVDVSKQQEQIQNITDKLNDMYKTGQKDVNGQEVLPFDTNTVLQNMDMVKAATQGDIDAMNQLAIMAGKSYIAHLQIDGDTHTVDAMRNNLYSLISQLDGANIAIGTSMDNSPVIQGLIAIGQQAKMTSEQIAEMIKKASGGTISADVDYTTAQVDLPVFDTVTHNGKTFTARVGYNSNKQTVKIPRFKYKYTGAGGTKANYGGGGGSSSKGSGGSGGGGGGGSSSELQEEVFDWIDVAINRAEEQISRLDKVVENTYDKWTNRSKALNDEISKTSDEMKLQQQAYQGYIDKANSIGLSDSYKQKVQNGTIQIETVTDEDLKTKISDYQTWYNKAVECQDKIQELNISLSELAQKKFDNIVTQFEDMEKVFTDTNDILDKLVDYAETKGRIISKSYYEAMLQNENENNKLLVQQRDQMVAELNELVNTGKVTEYSEAWYDLQQQIDEVNGSIVESNKSIQEFYNNMRQADWDLFDLVQDKITGIADEIEFVQSLLDDRDNLTDGHLNRGLTNEGIAQLGNYASKYNIYMSQAEKYAGEIKKIEADIAKDPANKDLIDRKEELIKAQRDVILSANDEKKSMIDLARDGYDAMLEVLQELIDKRKEYLDNEKSIYEYQNTISEKTENLASLRKQLSVFENDNSEESLKKVQQLQSDIKDAEKDLKDTEYDKYIEDQEKMLDDLYQEYSDKIDEKFEQTEILIQELIGVVNENQSSISDTITTVTSDVGYTISDQMKTIWSDAGTVISGFTGKFDTYATTVQSAINSIQITIDKMLQIAQAEANKNIATANNPSGVTSGSTSNGSTASKQQATPKANTSNNSSTAQAPKASPNVGTRVNATGNWYYDSYGTAPTGNVNRFKPDYFEIDKIANGRAYPYHIQAIIRGKRAGGNGWVKGNQIGYKNGLKEATYDHLAWTQEEGAEIIRRSDGSILTPITRGTTVFTREMTDNLWNIAKQNPEKFYQNAMPTMNTFATTNRGGDVSVSIGDIKLDGVQNPDQFAQALIGVVKDYSKVQKVLQAATVDLVAGKSIKDINRF